MLSVVNHVANAANERKRCEHAHQSAYDILIAEAKAEKKYEWRELDADTQRELTLHRLHVDGLDVIDGDMLDFISALAGLFSRKALMSDDEAKEAINRLKNIIYGQMEFFVNRDIEPLWRTGEA